MEYLIITFESTNFAMQTENILKNLNVNYQVIPTPREVTLSCGLSIKLSMEYKERIIELISNQEIRVKSIFRVKKKDSGKIFYEIGR